MARMKRSVDKPAAVLYNIVYEDGALSSNRKVPSDVLNGMVR